MKIWYESLADLVPGLFRVHCRGDTVWISFLNIGARIERWRRLDTDGKWIDLCLFYPDPRSYIDDHVYLGATIGRFANRIAQGRFSLNGKIVELDCNESGKNHIHGGASGFSHQFWHLKNMDTQGVEFSLDSPDGDQLYPGAVRMTVSYCLDGEDQLRIIHRGQCDQTTVLNTTNHAYFNLNGIAPFTGDSRHSTILQHRLQMESDCFLHTDVNHIPSGKIESVTDSTFDFRRPRALSDKIRLFPYGRFNVTYIGLPKDHQRIFAHLIAPDSRWALSVGSDAPAAIFYSGFSLSKSITRGLYKPYAGFCVEPQYYPDCVNHPEWPSAVMTPSETYLRIIIYRLTKHNEIENFHLFE